MSGVRVCATSPIDNLYNTVDVRQQRIGEWSLPCASTLKYSAVEQLIASFGCRAGLPFLTTFGCKPNETMKGGLSYSELADPPHCLTITVWHPKISR